MIALPIALVLAGGVELSGARFRSGSTPALPPLAQNGGLVVLELRVAPSGIVKDTIVINDAPPFTEEMRKVIRLWSFRMAEEGRDPAKVAVVGLFRAPQLFGAGPPDPVSLRRPSAEIPYPVATAAPDYPPQALYSTVVMLEVEVDERGQVAGVEILTPDEGFDEVSVEAARKFQFRPAEREGRPVPAHAVLVFGIPQPVTPVRPRE
jgi:TonB family protein